LRARLGRIFERFSKASPHELNVAAKAYEGFVFRANIRMMFALL